MVRTNLVHKSPRRPTLIGTTLKKRTVKWCSISLSDVISHGKRLEASVFDVHAKQAREIVSKGKYKPTSLFGENGLIENAYYPGWIQRSRLKRIWCDRQYGEGFYLPSQMTDVYPVAEKYISRLADCDMDELRLKKNTLLLTRSGTIGSVSLVSETLDGLVFSDDVIRISFKNDFDLGYVYAFLKTKVGNIILTTNGYGSVVTHIEPEHLSEIHIPDVSVGLRKRIHGLIMQSYALRDESNALINEATRHMIEELQLPRIWEFNVARCKKNACVETFSVKLSDMDGRADASYHVPIVNAIVKHLKKYAEEVTTIGDARISKAVVLPPRFARVYVDEGHGRVLIGGKQLYELDPSGKKYLSNTKHKRLLDQLEVHQNTVLITRSGTIGKVAFVPRHWEHWIPSDHIIRVVPANDDIAGYIYVFLNSDYGSQLINRYTYGSVVDEIDDNHVRQVAIPLLKNKEAQKRINDLALAANEKRYEAYKLEQQALDIMDNEVIYAK